MAQVMPLDSDASSARLSPHPNDGGTGSNSAAVDEGPPAVAATLDVEAAILPAGEDADGCEKPPVYVDVTYMDIAREFSILGYIGFGGPAAHIGLFQKVCAPCYHNRSIVPCVH